MRRYNAYAGNSWRSPVLSGFKWRSGWKWKKIINKSYIHVNVRRRAVVRHRWHCRFTAICWHAVVLPQCCQSAMFASCFFCYLFILLGSKIEIENRTSRENNWYFILSKIVLDTVTKVIWSQKCGCTDDQRYGDRTEQRRGPIFTSFRMVTISGTLAFDLMMQLPEWTENIRHVHVF